MSNLDLDIVKKDEKTHTTFRMKWYETVVFHNYDSNDPLVVAIQGDKRDSPPVLCDTNGEAAKQPITIGPLGSKGYGICRNYQGTHFTYTAKIGGAAGEDPIVIIER